MSKTPRCKICGCRTLARNICLECEEKIKAEKKKKIKAEYKKALRDLMHY